MIIAITAKESSLQSEVDPRFGRAAYFLIANSLTGEVYAHDNTAGIEADNGAGTGASQLLAEYKVDVLYTGHVGPKAADVLEKAKIPYYENITGTVQSVIDRLKNGDIQQNATLTDQNTSAQTGNQPTMNDNPAVAPQCPGAIPGAKRGMGMGAGRGQGMGRGMGAGRGGGRGQGMGRR